MNVFSVATLSRSKMFALKKFFNPQNLIDCYKPLLYYQFATFVFPYQIQKDQTFGYSKITARLYFAISLIFFSIDQSGIFLRLTKPSHFDNPLLALSFIHFLLNRTYWLTAIIMSFTNHKNFVNIFQKFQKLENDLKLPKEDYKKIFYVCIIEIIVNILLSIWASSLVLLLKTNAAVTIVKIMSTTYVTSILKLNEFNSLNAVALLEKYVRETHRNLLKLASLNNNGYKRLENTSLRIEFNLSK